MKLVSSLSFILTGIALIRSTQGQPSDCPYQGGAIDLTGDGTLLLRQSFNPKNFTIHVEVEYCGTAWVGIAFAGFVNMLGFTGIIGLPDDDTVLKYDMTSREISGVVPAPSFRQTLFNTRIVQANGRTIMRFSRNLREPDDPAYVTLYDNLVLFAYGSSNTLDLHIGHGYNLVSFTACIPETPSIAPSQVPTPLPTRKPASKKYIAPTRAPVFFPVPRPAVPNPVIPVPRPVVPVPQPVVPVPRPVIPVPQPVVPKPSAPVIVPTPQKNTSSPTDKPNFKALFLFLVNRPTLKPQSSAPFFPVPAPASRPVFPKSPTTPTMPTNLPTREPTIQTIDSPTSTPLWEPSSEPVASISPTATSNAPTTVPTFATARPMQQTIISPTYAPLLTPAPSPVTPTSPIAPPSISPPVSSVPISNPTSDGKMTSWGAISWIVGAALLSQY